MWQSNGQNICSVFGQQKTTENLREEQDVGSEVRKQMLAPKNVDKYSALLFLPVGSHVLKYYVS